MPVTNRQNATPSGLRPHAASLPRGGFTLVEMLVSLAITLIMMGAVVSLFGLISDSVSGSRSIIEISERLRAARNRLQADLQGATATMTPPLRPEADEGYFEVIEGPMRDFASLDFAGGSLPSGTALGDFDDALMLTVRSRGEPFVGLYTPAEGAPTTIESQVAEVIYFCAHAPDAADATLYIDPTSGEPVRLFTLYRRVLLVAPQMQDTLAADMNLEPSRFENFFLQFDISAKRVIEVDPGPPQPRYAMVPNTLGDLTKRENRFGHYGAFPYDVNVIPPVIIDGIIPPDFPNGDETVTPFVGGRVVAPFFEGRLGDDVLLTNVLSFDVQVFDPDAPVDVTTEDAFVPSDPGYAVVTDPVLGAYVDLGWEKTGGGGSGQFHRSRERTITAGIVSRLLPTLPANTVGQYYTYDTWSLHYENNGIDDDDGGGGPIDEGTNGFDDDASGELGYGIVDDPIVVNASGVIVSGEAETTAPFIAPLRGIKVTIRVYEPGSQQVRQVTVVQDFLPE